MFPATVVIDEAGHGDRVLEGGSARTTSWRSAPCATQSTGAESSARSRRAVSTSSPGNRYPMEHRPSVALALTVARVGLGECRAELRKLDRPRGR